MAAGAGALQVAIGLPSNEAVRSAVMAGPFATAMSELVVALHLQAGLLVQAGFELPERSFAMLRHLERHRSRAATLFEELVRIPPGTNGAAARARGQKNNSARVE